MLQTVAPDPTLLRPSKNFDIAEQKEAHEGKETTSEGDVLRNLEQLSEGNEIRIFDADKEHTQRYRSRILPDNFLNSEKTQDGNASHSRKRTFQNTDPSVCPTLQPLDKRIRRETTHSPASYPYDAQPEPSRNQSLHSSLDDRYSAAHKRGHDAHRSYIRTQRTKVDSPVPHRSKTHALRLSRLRQSSPTDQKKEHGLRNHSESWRQRNTTGEFIFNNSSSSLCHSVSPKKVFEAVSSHARSGVYCDRAKPTGSHELAREVLPPPAKEEGHRLHYFPPSPTDESALQERPLVPRTKALSPTIMSKRFPPIDIESEFEPVSNGEHSARPEYDSFQCILSREPFQLSQISAEVLRIEHELLNDPDPEVRIFSRSRHRQQNKGLDVCRYSNSNASPAETNKNQNSLVLENENVIPKPNTATFNHSITSGDNPSRHFDLEQDLDVTLSLLEKNPVTEAGATERANSITFPGDTQSS